MYKSSQFPEDMVAIVNEFVQELLRDKFAENLLALLKASPAREQDRASSALPCCMFQSLHGRKAPDVKRQHDVELWSATPAINADHNVPLPSLPEQAHGPDPADAVRQARGVD